MAKELDIVALRTARPDLRLQAGARGTIVAVLDGAWEVEFSDAAGEPVTTPVLPADVVVVWRIDDVSHGKRAAG